MQRDARGHKMKKLTLCILTVAASTGLTLGAEKYAQAVCGDGVTTVGEACDNGTAVCAAGAKNAGTECHKASDCTGGPAGKDLCQPSPVCKANFGSPNQAETGAQYACNRDDVPNACRSNCMLPMCGDGVSDSTNNEQCDDGGNNGSGKPCYGSAPNTVCSNATGVVIATWADVGSPAGHNPAAMIPCTADGQCSIYGLFCRGNPQCRLNQCGDGVVCSDAACTTGLSLVAPGIPSPEQCDDGNTSNMDACLNYNYTATIGTAAIPEACASNICGDGISNMGVEQCDVGASVCLDGPKTGKPCCTNSDCMLGNVMGTLNCSGVVGLLGNDNNNAPNAACRCNCTLPFCGDGISDNEQNEECDDGTTANSPGQFCNKEQRCVGGENGCIDANANGQCDSDATENTSRLAAPLCSDNPNVCVKGTCGKTACVQNTCGDEIVGGNEMCDDGNTVNANSTTDSCGVNVTTWIAFAQATGCDTTLADNLPGGCPPANCMLPFCGDGVTEDGEMCDAGASTCSQALADAAIVQLFNPGALCCSKSDCKTSKLADGTTPDVCGPSPLGNGGGNRNDVPNACRCNCMPPLCGDGVSDTGEQCEPPASGTFCIKNAMGMCVLNTCGDGDVCNKTATDACLTVVSGHCVPGPRACTSGPIVSVSTGQCTGASGAAEQCDDANTVDPSGTNLDTCSTICCASTCGDGVTNPTLGEQCDAMDNGCSNGREDLSLPSLPPQCCFDGNVVDADLVGLFPGLISVERGFAALLGCRMPNLVGMATCRKTLQRAFSRVQAKITAAQIYLEFDNITKSRRLMRTAERGLYLQTRRIARLAAPGKACAAVGLQLAKETANAAFLTGGIVAHLTEDSAPFGP
jgi:hypothetical protein